MLAGPNDRGEFSAINGWGGVGGPMVSDSVSRDAVKQGSTSELSLGDLRLWEELSSENEVKGVDPRLTTMPEVVEDDGSDVSEAGLREKEGDGACETEAEDIRRYLFGQSSETCLDARGCWAIYGICKDG